MKIRTRRSQAAWLSLIQQQIESGMTAAEFCREHRLDEKYFSKRKRASHNAGDASVPANRFIQVHTAQPIRAASAATLVLHYRNTQLHIPASTDPQVLAQLMLLLS
jgi:hypothetical protein